MAYNFKQIEKKWQKKWEEKKAFVVKENSKKKKSYVAEMYPYPSGAGLHIGHAFNEVIGDILARFKIMNGFNVLHPMGYDSFGLPAENAAINAKSHPKKFTDEAIENFIKQQKALGFSYDWTRMIKSHDPKNYKWDQWIFLKMFEKGLAYRKKAPVNWCPKCNTVLANEQVHGGKCWRHEDTYVHVKQLEQWFLKITDYANELYEDTKKLTHWPEKIKIMQENWIGKSYGAEIDFKINGKKYTVFTTRPDTIYGVTFLVVSAQHPDLMEFVKSDRKNEIDKFLKKIKSTSEKELENLEKEGVFTGTYAEHPITGEEIPVWVGNFVVAEYGSGIVMGVPAHDQRDLEFSEKYGLGIIPVIKPEDKNVEPFKAYGRAIIEPGELINSEQFDGMHSEKAKEEIVKYLEKKKIGRKTVNFKLRDWLISRQRFWGTPIPIIYCDKCEVVPVNEKDLPVVLPENIKFTSEKNPLENYKPFLETKCPRCSGKGRRETDTMDTFVNSSWYFLRYTDPKNNKKIFDKKKADYWMPMDFYTGGAEHACMHLIYSRFYTRFLGEIGLINNKIKEPAVILFNQGMVHAEDNKKMSKSLGNVVDPLDMANKFGADTLRAFLISVASPDSDYSWNPSGIEGMHKFVKKIYEFFENYKPMKNSSRIVESKINRTIKDVTEDIENVRYNLAIIKIRKLFDTLSKENVSKKDAEIFLKLLSPFCPHITEEFWERLGNKSLISLSSWPKADIKKIDEKIEKQEEIFEKLIEDIIYISRLLQERERKQATKGFVYVLPKDFEHFRGKNEEIENRTNLKIEIFAVNDNKKYDPEGKSKKVKPDRPGIYLE